MSNSNNSNPYGPPARRSSYASVLAGNQASAALAAAAPARTIATPSSSFPPQPQHLMQSQTFDSSEPNPWFRRPDSSTLGTYSLNPPTRNGSFFIPTYLVGTRYAERLKAEHDAKISRTRSASMSGVASLSTSASSTNLPGSHKTHRGLAHDVVENAPKPLYPEDPPAPLPSKWNIHDKNPGLEVLGGGLELKFTGANKSHDEAAVARADHPIPKIAGIYYFEVTVLSKGKEGLLSIGFCAQKVTLTRLPGWEPESWAYHGDDGHVFNSNQHGKPYGPKYGNGDTIGCGINFRTGIAFFTKNGNNLGTASRDITSDKLYPTVGMKKQQEHIKVNFGQVPFLYDINSLYEAERAQVKDDIAKADVANLYPPFAENYLVQQLISQYLVHDGFVESAQVFAQEVNEEYAALQSANRTGSSTVKTLETHEDADATNRQHIRTAILDGDIDSALSLAQEHYPSVLDKNFNLYFKLRCRKFIEMVRTRLGDNDRLRKSKDPVRNLYDLDGGVFDHQMELDEPSTNGNVERPAPVTDEDLLVYGQELSNQFKSATQPWVKSELDSILGLMAYENPKNSTLKDLLEVQGRAMIAEELNKAILVSQGKSSFAALERVVQQTELLLRYLGDEGGPGAFVNLSTDYINPDEGRE